MRNGTLRHFLLTYILLAISCIGATTSAFAQNRWYSIEVLVFENTSEAGSTAESWSENVDEPRTGFALSPRGGGRVGVLTAGSSEASSIAAVPRSQLAYVNLVKRLAQSGRYRHLVHIGWRQPGLEKSEALPVRIAGSSSAAPDASGVRGTIRVYTSGALQLETDLVYNRSDSARFALRESRVMRSGELHYLDHPLFGVLVRVIPYQPPGGEYVPGRAPVSAQTQAPLQTPTPEQTPEQAPGQPSVSGESVLESSATRKP